jgi:hypothetical protein
MNGPALLDQTKKRVTAPLDDIVLAAQAGSAAAFAELYSTYSRRLFQTILPLQEIHTMRRKRFRRHFSASMWRLKHLKVNRKYTLG